MPSQDLQFSKQDRTIGWAVWIVFTLAVLFFKLSYHELWKDEWQAWFVATDQGLFDMLGFLNYEGHPMLWYLYLKVASIFQFLAPESPETIIQIAHWLIVAATAWVWLLRLRLPWLYKLLFLGSYHFAFEYGVINRGYALVMLLAFLATDFIARKRFDGFGLPLVVFLLTQTEVYGLFLAGGFCFYLLQGGQFQWTKSASWFDSTIKKRSLGALVLGTLVFILVVWPRGRGEEFARAYVGEAFSQSAILDGFQGLLANNYAIGLIPDTSAYGWSGLGLGLSVASLLIVASLLAKRRRLLWTYLITFLVFWLFSTSFYGGGVRQWGNLFLFSLCLFVLLEPDRWSWQNPRKWLLILLAVAPLLHAGRSIARDAQLPFTNAQAAGEFLKEKVPERVPIIAINKFEATPVTGYADRPFFELPSGEPFTFFRWLERIYIPTEDEFRLLGEYKQVGGIIVISPQPLDPNRYPNLQAWQNFAVPSYKPEQYWVYTLALN
ncbi:MAG: hypothetical protein AAFY36_08025 [Bacteroidota bacterium]